ncbi:hypothetical protein D3C78_1777490 [compost metagenome]
MVSGTLAWSNFGDMPMELQAVSRAAAVSSAAEVDKATGATRGEVGVFMEILLKGTGSDHAVGMTARGTTRRAGPWMQCR